MRFQIVIMTKGWARFMYEDKSTLVQAGDVVHQRLDVPPAVENVPSPTPWK
jgi:quercetin dioxygenase-like cupin family protein